MDPQIDFYSEDIDFNLNEADAVRNWINQIIENHQAELESLTFIFCSDEYLHQINVEYLDHDTYTDIITFNNADEPGIIEGDIFVSIDRVKDNSEQLNIPFRDELHRVIIHGVLHLLGFDDKTDDSAAIMRKEEDTSLSLRNF